MADETAKLVVAVDSTSVQAASKDLDSMTEAARQAQRETRGFTAEQIAAMRAVAGGSSEYERINQRLDALRDKERAAAMAARELAQAQAASVPAAGKAEEAIKKVSGAHANFSFSSGQAVREYGVLVNELQRGDFTRLEGSFITLANRVGVMPAIFSAILSPLGLLIIALGVLGVAAVKGAADQKKYNDAMIATGDYAHTSYGEVMNMAKGMEDSNTTLGQARESLEAVAESGRFFRDEIAKAGQGVDDFAKLTGQSVDDAVKQFIRIKDDPVHAAEELNKTFHFLSVEVRDAARAAQEHGDSEQAASIILDAVEKSSAERMKREQDNVGYLGRSWQWLKGVVSDAWQAMNDVGKTKDIDMQVAERTSLLLQAKEKLDDDLASYKKGGFLSPSASDLNSDTQWVRNLIKDVDELHKKQADAHAPEIAAAAEDRHTEAVLRATGAIHDYMTQYDRAAKRKQEIDKIHSDFAIARSSKDPNISGDAAYSMEAEAKAVADAEHRWKDYKEARVAATQAEKDAKKEQTAHDQQLKTLDQTIAEHRAIVDQEAKSTKDLTELQKWGQRQIELLSDSHTHLSASEQKVREEQIRAIVAQGDLNDARQAEAKVTEDATRALERYAKQGAARDVQNQRALNAVGHSGDWASEQARQYQIIDEAENARIQLTDKARAAEQLETQAYKDGIAAIGEEMNRQLNLEQKFYADRKAAMGDWRNGAQRAWEEFSNKANDVAGQTYDAFNTAFSGMENAIDQFAKTGKFKFSDFARTVLAELAKIELRILLSKILTSMFGGAMSGSADLGGTTYGQSNTYEGGYGAYNGAVYSRGMLTPFANGGSLGRLISQPTYFPMANGGTGLGGEQGEEGLFPITRNSRGQLALHTTGSSGGGDVNSHVTVIIQNDGTSKVENTDANSRQAKMLGEFLTQRVKDILVGEQRQGGILWRMNNG